jgi:glycosyltransferase involved in cell wall biosynthesis
MKGGIVRFSGLLHDSLQQAGHLVIPVPYRKLYPRWLTPVGSSCEPAAAAPEDQHPFRLDLFNPLSWIRTARQLRGLQPDVLLAAYWIGIQAPLFFVLRLFSGIPTVILLHNFTSHESIPAEPLLKKLLVASADGFITLSGSVLHELKGFSGSARAISLFHPVYEPHGALPSKATARIQLGIGGQARLLLFFGYVRDYKGLDLLLEALSLVIHQDPSVRLLVAGEFFRDIGYFREMAARLGIGGHVDFQPGYVPAERVAPLFRAADAVVMPYRTASQSGVVQLAFGHGIPVIVNDVGGLAGQVAHRRTGWVVSNPGPETLAEAIQEFFREKDLQDMGRNIEQARTAMSWKAFGEAAAGFLNEIGEGK